MEKHIDQHRPLYHNCIDFKISYFRVWHEGLWHTLKTYGISKELIDIISVLYASSGSSVLVNNHIGKLLQKITGSLEKSGN